MGKKIFHGLVNYGTQAGLFSVELKNQGYQSISVGEEDKYNRLIDVQLYSNMHFFKKTFLSDL